MFFNLKIYIKAKQYKPITDYKEYEKYISYNELKKFDI